MFFVERMFKKNRLANLCSSPKSMNVEKKYLHKERNSFIEFHKRFTHILYLFTEYNEEQPLWAVNHCEIQNTLSIQSQTTYSIQQY